MADREIGRDTSPNLIQIRTVLSRAETALNDLHEERVDGHYCYGRGNPGPLCKRDCPQHGESGFHETARYPDPDYAEAREALEALVINLSKFARTGRPRKT